jgi:hypothetical protein
MPFVVWAEVKYAYVPVGAGTALLGQQQAEVPGFTGVVPPAPAAVPAAQMASDVVMEPVPGGESPTGANFQTALNAAAADAYTRLIGAGQVPGFSGTGTLLATVQGWSTGNP